MDGLTVSVDVTNTGQMAGKEIVQVYVHDQKSSLARPPKELKGFAKVALQPGETKTVSIPLDFRAFAYYHPGYQQWITEDGDFDILVGASSADIRASARVTLQSTWICPACSIPNRPFGNGWKIRVEKWIFEPMFDQIIAQLGQAMGGSEGGTEMDGMDMMSFLQDMPLLSILHFQDRDLPIYPDDLVAGMLQQVQQLAKKP